MISLNLLKINYYYKGGHVHLLLVKINGKCNGGVNLDNF